MNNTVWPHLPLSKIGPKFSTLAIFPFQIRYVYQRILWNTSILGKNSTNGIAILVIKGLYLANCISRKTIYIQG